MKPQDYKGKQVIHVPSQVKFTVTGGQLKKSGACFLKDDFGNLYPLDECELVTLDRLEFDLRRLKAADSLKELANFFEVRGRDRFQQTWAELEKDPIEAAAVAIFYCENWEDFCCLTEAYGVSKERSPELNQKFRYRLKEKGLDNLIKEWYSNATA